jgi:uroporphyrin-III C-methyltransferase
MSETPAEDLPPQNNQPEVQPATPKRRRSDGPSPLAAILCVLAIVAAAAAWYDTHRQLNAARELIAKQVHDNAEVSRNAELIAREALEALRELQAKVGALDAKQAESKGQQAALESLYQELSRNRDDWVLAEVEQVLTIASQQLHLAGNVQAALLALQSADARLARSDRPQFLALRKAIARDIQKLRGAPNVDVTGMTLRLDHVIAAVERLPLLVDGRAKATPSYEAFSPDDPWYKRWPLGAWQEIKQLVRVQRLDAVDQKLLSPEQRYFARENLKLRLLHARVALLQRDQAAFRSDMQESLQLLRNYFDGRERETASAIGTLTQLQGAAIDIELPNISESLSAAQSAKLPRERSR